MRLKHLRLKTLPLFLAGAALAALTACAQDDAPDLTQGPGPGTPPIDTGTLVGDFAPIRVGHEWTYEKETGGASGCHGQPGSVKGTRVVKILSRREAGDTLIYILSIRDSLPGTTGAGGQPPVVTALQDSILETRAGVLLTGDRFPFFDAHLKNDKSLSDTVDFGGARVFAINRASNWETQNSSGMTQHTRQYTHARDLGLYRYYEGTAFAGTGCYASYTRYTLTAVSLAAGAERAQ